MIFCEKCLKEMREKEGFYRTEHGVFCPKCFDEDGQVKKASKGPSFLKSNRGVDGCRIPKKGIHKIKTSRSP
jgi:hypothetical protein